MKGDTVLDYAEFQLTPKRTRCELFISADGVMEKLASGFVKPFITHLRAVEVQVARGNQVIRLESQVGFTKHHHHQKSDDSWFCKGTLERFVRFVSTPEVIERVKTIEDELSQLEQVRSALINTFAQNPDRFTYGDSTPGGQQTRDGTHVVPRRFSTDMEDNQADASKRELLRAMDARLSALHQEQNIAFTRANAAGFDSNNIADLMTFADDFGAERLNDACAQFLALYRKRMVPKGGPENTSCPAVETPSDGSACAFTSGFKTNPLSSDEAWLQGAKRKLDFGTNKVPPNNSDGLETRGTGPGQKDLSHKMGSGVAPFDHQTTKQHPPQEVDTRSSEDFGRQMDAESNESLSQNGAPASTSWRQAATDESLRNPYKNEALVPERSHSLPALRVRTEGPGLRSVEAQSVKNSTSEDGTTKPETMPCMESDRNNSQGEMPARRLSVQAAISLFESKKESNEPPFRKLIKQESRKALAESVSSPSEKSVLKRWSGANPFSPEPSSVQGKKSLDSGAADRIAEVQHEKAQDEANQVSSLDKTVEAQQPPPVAPDEQARENFKKSLSSLLQLDTTQHFSRSKEPNVTAQHVKQLSPIPQPPMQHVGRSKESDLMVQHMKQLSPIPQPPTQHFSRPKESDLIAQHVKQLSPIPQPPPPPIPPPSTHQYGSTLGPDSKDQSSIHCPKDLSITKMDIGVSSEAESEFSRTAAMPTQAKPLEKPITEEKPETQHPAPNMTSLDYTVSIEREDKGMMKGQNMKEVPPKPSGPISYRQKVSASMLMEQNVGPVGLVVCKPEQASDKKAEAIKVNEVPHSDQQTGQNVSYRMSPLHRKASSRREMTTSVDFHMQALVKMVEHQYTNLSLNGLDMKNEQRGEQRGRLYDQYSKLRDAKIRGEHPAKRAEREAKLKSMQETLERRKAEMETRVVKLSKKKVREAHASESGGEKMQRQKAGLTVAVVEQKDLKDEEDDPDQEEYTLRSQQQTLDYSNPTSPASTPRSAKSRSSSLKVRAPAKITPPPKSSSARNPARVSAISSPRSTLKSPGGIPSQGKTSSLNNSSGDTLTVKAVLNMRDMAKSSLLRTTASARVHPRLNSSANDLTLGEDVNNVATLANPEKKELRHPSLAARKNVASIAVSKSLPTEAGMLQGSPKDHQGATDAMDDGKTLGATQEVKPFLRKGRGIGPGAGPGIMKQKASVLVDNASTDKPQDGASLTSEDILSTSENCMEVNESEEAGDAGRLEEQEALDTSCTAMLPTLNDDSISSSSGPSSGGPTDSGEVEALDDPPESASENDKPCPDTVSPTEEHHEETRPGVMKRTTQGSILQVLDNKEKEGTGTFMLSDLLSQRNKESLPQNAGYVTSSMSFREPSLPHGHIGSPSPASMSHTYSSLLQRGAISSRFSPPRTNALDLPTGSPALWHASPARKYMPEPPDMSHSNRQLNGPKPASMLPLPPKEPSKGFKRLLNFGRKSRPSETTTDCVSVSTTSEGDDDADEVREMGSQVSDEVLRKIRMQKRGYEFGNVGDHYGFADQDTSQFFGSAIPPPPANFKLREDHLSGSNLIKAPRSFFSLSSFRSKGGDGKSR